MERLLGQYWINQVQRSESEVQDSKQRAWSRARVYEPTRRLVQAGVEFAAGSYAVTWKRTAFSKFQVSNVAVKGALESQ